MDNLEQDSSEVEHSEPDVAESATPEVEAQPEPALQQEESAEDKAKAKGWRPKEEYSGENEWVDAETYLRNGSYLREINKLKKIITNLSDTLSKSEERAYKKALGDLETKRKEAELTSDIVKYKEVENEAKELQKQFNVTSESKPTNVMDNSEVKVWLAQNPWFSAPKTEEDFDKAALAKSASTFFAKNNPGAPLADELAFVNSKIQAKFGAKEESKPKVLAAGTKPAGVSKDEFHGLDSGQKMVVDYLKRTGQDYKTFIKNAKEANKK